MSNYLLVENASKSFGDIELFNNITFAINKGNKVGLVARNGAGKTTLLNILAGKDSFNSGRFYINKDIQTGYLEQDPVFNPGLTLFQAVYGSSGVLMETVRNYESAILEHDEKKLVEATAQMDFHRAWDLDSRIKQMLGILKLGEVDKLVGTLSGGQVKRLALAVTLIHDPDLLILDEPTNHLDLDMIEWLEDYLLKSKVTLLMITHDRYFLERICNEILELDEKSLYSYKGNYSEFLRQREERLFSKIRSAEKARNLLRSELDWIRRMPKARTTKPKFRIDAYYDLKKQSEYRPDNQQVEINVQTSRLGKKIIEVDQVSIGYGNTKILDHFSYTFSRKEKLGIIGRNGVGKTTFLNLVTGEILPDSGTIEQGETVVYGYYRQVGLEFKSEQRVIDRIREIAEVITMADGRLLTASQFLNFFLFPPEKQYVPVSKLSGGEKRRLYLMTILMRNPNFLVLDEPTNDFDIVTLNVLEEYLSGFNGCLIIVSHDRFFMDKLVDHLFIFEGDGVIYDFPGNYSDYRVSQKQSGLEDQMTEKILQKGSNESRKARTPGGEKKRLSYKEKIELESLTVEIEVLEKEKAEIEKSLSGGSIEPDELALQAKRLSELKVILEEKTNRWFELSEIIS